MSDLKIFLLWILFIIVFIGIIDTVMSKHPIGNDEENQIIRPSYDHSSFSVFLGKQE